MISELDEYYKPKKIRVEEQIIFDKSMIILNYPNRSTT